MVSPIPRLWRIFYSWQLTEDSLGPFDVGCAVISWDLIEQTRGMHGVFNAMIHASENNCAGAGVPGQGHINQLADDHCGGIVDKNLRDKSHI